MQINSRPTLLARVSLEALAQASRSPPRRGSHATAPGNDWIKVRSFYGSSPYAVSRAEPDSIL